MSRSPVRSRFGSPAIGDLSFRLARASDAEAMARVAWAAKASRGYPIEWLLLWRDDLEPTPASIETNWYSVCESAAGVAGFVSAQPLADGKWDLSHLWVRPEWQGRGVGAALLLQTVSHCRELGGRTLVIVSDPGAEPFYRSMGAQRVGAEPSRPAGRELPVLELDLGLSELSPVSKLKTIHSLEAPDRSTGRSLDPSTDRSRVRSSVREFLLREAGSTRVLSRGSLHQVDELPCFLGRLGGRLVALLAYAVDDRGLEVVALHSSERALGFGTLLLDAAYAIAQRRACRRLWLTTTIENEPAIRFCIRRGLSLVAVHTDPIARSRRVHEMASVGESGQPAYGEVEFEHWL